MKTLKILALALAVTAMSGCDDDKKGGNTVRTGNGMTATAIKEKGRHKIRVQTYQAGAAAALVSISLLAAYRRRA